MTPQEEKQIAAELTDDILAYGFEYNGKEGQKISLYRVRSLARHAWKRREHGPMKNDFFMLVWRKMWQAGMVNWPGDDVGGEVSLANLGVSHRNEILSYNDREGNGGPTE